MRRLREQDGFTLVELLSTQVIGGFVLMAAMMGVLVSLRVSNDVGDRAASTQTGRIAVEQVGQRLRSQTCLFAGEYRLNNGPSPATTRASGFLHASSNKLIFMGDIGNSPGATGATGAVGFQPQIRWFDVTGTVGPTGLASLREGWLNATNSTRPYNFTVTPATSLDTLATTAGAAALNPTTWRAVADRLQYSNGLTRHFTYFNDAGATVTESGGAVPVASLETITRVQLAFKVAGSNPAVTTSKTSQFVNDFYVRTITDRCEGG